MSLYGSETWYLTYRGEHNVEGISDKKQEAAKKSFVISVPHE